MSNQIRYWTYNVLVVVLAYLILVCYSPISKADEKCLKIAVLNTEKVIAGSSAVQDLKLVIQNASDRIEHDLTQKEIELKRIELDLVSKQEILKEEEYENRIKLFNKDVSKAQRKVRAQKQNLEQAYGSAMQEIHNQIISIVKDLAKESGFDLVLPHAQLIFADIKFDITSQVIERLNQIVTRVEINLADILAHDI